MKSSFWKLSGVIKVVSLSLLTNSLFGCAVNTHGDIIGEFTPLHGQHSMVEADLGRFFENATSGAVFHATHSPWGDGVDIIVAAVYAAASGRRCRDLSVQGKDSGMMPAIVCRIQSEQWESVRPITRGAGL